MPTVFQPSAELFQQRPRDLHVEPERFSNWPFVEVGRPCFRGLASLSCGRALAFWSDKRHLTVLDISKNLGSLMPAAPWGPWNGPHGPCREPLPPHTSITGGSFRPCTPPAPIGCGLHFQTHCAVWLSNPDASAGVFRGPVTAGYPHPRLGKLTSVFIRGRIR